MTASMAWFIRPLETIVKFLKGNIQDHGCDVVFRRMNEIYQTRLSNPYFHRNVTVTSVSASRHYKHVHYATRRIYDLLQS